MQTKGLGQLISEAFQALQPMKLKPPKLSGAWLVTKKPLLQNQGYSPGFLSTRLPKASQGLSNPDPAGDADQRWQNLPSPQPPGTLPWL